MSREYKEIVSHHLFLTQNAGIQEFCKNFVHNKNKKSWSVVCERTEDVSPIRVQIIRELESILGSQQNIFGGISVYTIDQLGRNFCSSLALSHDKNIKALLPNFIFKPYVEISKQEKIVGLILDLFHFSAQGNVVLAKQLLALLDIQLPPDLSIFDALNSALNLKRKRSYKDISEVFLKQILASFQASHVVLNRYARFQNLVWDFLQTDFWKLMDDENIQDTLVFPEKFLSGSILWVSAPEYQNTSSTNNFKPGDFLSALVDDFFKFIVKLKSRYFNSDDSVFIHNRTILKSENVDPGRGQSRDLGSSGEVPSGEVPSRDDKIQPKKNLDHISLYSASNAREFYQKTLECAHIKDDTTLVFLGEFDSTLFQTICPNARGSYKALKKDFITWQNKQENNHFNQEISAQLDTHYDDFLDSASYIENYSKISDIAKIYSIPIRELTDEQLNEMFYSYAMSERFDYMPEDRLANFLKPFSFFSTPYIPEKLLILWGSNHFEQTNFATRLLNQVFSFLQSHSLDIDNPFTEKTFTNFWKHIVYLQSQFPNLKIDFFVDSPSSLENFPIDFKKKKFFPFLMPSGQNPEHQKIFESTKEQIHSIVTQKFSSLNLDEFWLKSLFDQIPFETVSTTQFESYIKCPFQFFLEQCVKLKLPRDVENFSIEPQTLGTQVHKICDSLISHMVTKFGNDGYIEYAPALYASILSAIGPSEIFLSPKKDVWKTSLEFLKKDEQVIFSEIIDEIFDSPHDLCTHEKVSSSSSPYQLSAVLFEEMMKRTFLKLLQTEIKNIQAGHKVRVGIVREYPFEIRLSNLILRGRIDRVDVNKDGYEIIDYKVSPISKTEKTLCILPSEMQIQKNQGTLSIQGAIYALAFGKKVFDSNTPSVWDNEDAQNSLSAFSLYRLKNSNEEDDAMLTYSFPKNDVELCGVAQTQRIEQELTIYAEKLTNKNFLPNPLLKKQTCQYCAFKNICPYPLKNEGIL